MEKTQIRYAGEILLTLTALQARFFRKTASFELDQYTKTREKVDTCFITSYECLEEPLCIFGNSSFCYMCWRFTGDHWFFDLRRLTGDHWYFGLRILWESDEFMLKRLLDKVS